MKQLIDKVVTILKGLIYFIRNRTIDKYFSGNGTEEDQQVLILKMNHARNINPA